MKRLSFLIILVSALSHNVSAADGWLDRLKQNFQSYWQTQQPEKLDLHLNRTVFASPDTIWFKAYLTDLETSKPHNSPEVVALTIYSPENGSVLTQKVKAVNGLAAGSIVLPDSLKAGNYLLKANTNWQRNTGPGASFQQVIFINTVPKTNKTVANSSQKVIKEISFYPEGGKLIAGQETKIAFKAVAADGSGFPVEGTITDGSGKVITGFKSQQNGIGSFNFMPQNGKTYSAQAGISGAKKSFPLPDIEKGYGLTVKNYYDSLQIIIASSTENSSEPVYLVLQNGTTIMFSDSVLVKAGSSRKKTFFSKNWDSGLCRATLFNARGTVENERLFEANPSFIKAKVSTAKSKFGRREPVQVNIVLQDNFGQPVQAELSVAAVSELYNPQSSLENSNLVIAGLPGAFPGKSTAIENAQALDNLLLTYKPQENFWEKFAQTPAAPQYSRETEIKSAGLATIENGKLSKAVIYLLDTKSHNSYLVTADENGKFPIPAPGVSRFFYQVWQNGVFRKDAKLQLLTEEYIPAPANWNKTAETDSVAFNKFSLRQRIEKIYNPRLYKQPDAKAIAALWPVYKADKYYPLEEYNEFTTMEEIFREIIPSVRIVTKNGQTNANIYNVERRDFYPHQPLYIIDGQPTWNSDLFLRLDASQLEQVNVYYSAKNLEGFGFFGNQGVISVFTKSGNYRNSDLNTEFILNIPGQNSAGEFTLKNRQTNIPDFRPTLYWNPNVKTSPEGKATINFQTSDEMGNIRVEVKGITTDGKIISEQLLVPVQPVE